jgi:hypothetical protein
LREASLTIADIGTTITSAAVLCDNIRTLVACTHRAINSVFEVGRLTVDAALFIRRRLHWGADLRAIAEQTVVAKRVIGRHETHPRVACPTLAASLGAALGPIVELTNGAQPVLTADRALTFGQWPEDVETIALGLTLRVLLGCRIAAAEAIDADLTRTGTRPIRCALQASQRSCLEKTASQEKEPSQQYKTTSQSRR